MSREIVGNIIFNLQAVTNYRLRGSRGLRIFQSLHYRYKLDTIFYQNVPEYPPALLGG